MTRREVRGTFIDERTKAVVDYTLQIEALPVGVLVSGQLRFVDGGGSWVVIPGSHQTGDTEFALEANAALFAQAAFNELRGARGA